MVGIPLCLNAPVAMHLPPACSNHYILVAMHKHRGRNAPLLDEMPHFGDSRFLGKKYYLSIKKSIICIYVMDSHDAVWVFWLINGVWIVVAPSVG